MGWESKTMTISNQEEYYNETIELIKKANEYISDGKANVNQEYRNNYHVMAPVGWINDPNGFVYYKGEYHLFYQHYPYDTVWGPMHWGHVKSKDLVHWEHMPVALAPTEEYELDGCFSGSAIEKDGKLYLMYTGHYERAGTKREVQCIAYSEDGIYFQKYKGNPVISENEIKGSASIEDFRDPKVFKKGDLYYSVVASKTKDERGRILLFSSKDLFNWSFKSVLLEGNKEQGIMWECPDLFNIDDKDVLIMSPIEIQKNKYEFYNINSTAVFIGNVDWQTGKFKVENYHEIDYGLDFYAPQTCIDEKNRRIMVAWMQMWKRNMPTNDLKHGWAGSMTLPRELHVKNNRLVQSPIYDIYELIKIDTAFQEKNIQDDTLKFENICDENSYFKLKLDVEKTDDFQIRFAKSENEFILISYDVKEEVFTVNREKSGHKITGVEKPQLFERSLSVIPNNNLLILEIFRDTSSLELFINKQFTVTDTFFPIEKGKDLEITAKGKLIVKLLEKGNVH